MRRGYEKYLFAGLLAFLLWVPGQSHAALPFNEDFESYTDTTAWHNSSTWGSSPCTLAQHIATMGISTTVSKSPTKSLREITYGDKVASPPAAYCWKDRQFGGSYEETYSRVWLFFASGWVASNINTKLYTQGQQDGHYPRVWWGVQGPNNGFRATPEGVPGHGSNWEAGTLPIGQWVCIEGHIKYNTPGVANGVLESWVDGQQRINVTNITWRQATETQISPGNFNGPASRMEYTRLYQQDGTGTRYFDDISFSTTRIGCGSVPPPVDTTPPQPPTNLTGNAASSTLTWTAGSDSGGSGYGGVQVFRCVRNPGDCTPTTQLAVVAAPATSYVDSGCSPGFTCDYRLRSYDGTGNVSLFTTEVSLTIPSTNRRVLFSDTFIRADNSDAGTNYTGGYTAGFSLKISSNKLAPSTVDNNNLERYNVAVPDDQWAMVQAVDGVNALDNLHVETRLSAGPTWNSYECSVINTTSGRVRRRDAGAGTELFIGTLSVPLQIGDRLRGESQGSSHRCYVIRTNAQGVQSEELVASATDGTYTTGSVGVRITTNGALPGIRLGEFIAGDFTGVVDSLITHDRTSTSVLTNTANPLTWTHTVGTSSNRLLTVCLQTRNTTAPVTVTGVTANGVSLTSVRSDSFTGANSLHTSLWRLIAPSSGANTIVATFSAAPSNWGVGASSSFSGVEQVAPVDAVGGSNGTGTAVSLAVTSTVTGTLAVDCAAGLADFTAVGASQTIRGNNIANPGADGVGVSTKPLASAGATTTSWTQSAASIWAGSVMAMKPAQVNNLQRPKVLNATFTPTGANGITYDTTTPTALRVVHGPNAGGAGVQEVTIPIASVPGGVLTRTWATGDQFAQIFAIDAFGILNSTNDEYVADSLVGIAPAANVNPVTITNPQPSTELPASTTSASITATIDQTQLDRECRWSDTDQAYASMTNQMTVNGTLASGTKTGLSNGQSYTVHRRCVTTDGGGTITSESVTSSSTFTVAASTVDVTPPGTVTNLVCTPSGTQADCAHTAAVDAVSYEAEISSDGGATYVLAKTYTGTSFSLLPLVPLQTYSVKVRARDVVGNPSAAYSNISTFVMPSLTDAIPPGDVPSLEIRPYRLSAEAVFTVGFDAANTTIEWCAGVGCSPGAFSKTSAASPILMEGLTPGTVYQATAFHNDSAGNPSAIKYPTITFTTPTTGLDGPRLNLQFGVVRPDAPRQASGTRIPRP